MKIKVADWLNLPLIVQQAIAGMDVESVVGKQKTVSGVLYHPVKIDGNLAALLSLDKPTTIHVQAADKQAAIEAAIAMVVDKKVQKYANEQYRSQVVQQVQNKYEQYISVRESTARRDALVQSTKTNDEIIYGLIKEGRAAGKADQAIISELASSRNLQPQQVQQAYGRHIASIKRKDRGEPLSTSSTVDRRANESNSRLIEVKAAIKQQLGDLANIADVKFVEDNSGGHYRVALLRPANDPQTYYGEPIKVSEAQGYIQINTASRNGYYTIGDMALTDKKRYGDKSFAAIGTAIAQAVRKQYDQHIDPQVKFPTNALKHLGISGSIASKEAKTNNPWTSSDLIQTHSEAGALIKLANIPQNNYATTPGRHFDYTYTKSGAMPLGVFGAIPGTQVNRQGRYTHVTSDDPLMKQLKRVRLQGQDYVEMGLAPNQPYPTHTSRVKAPGEVNAPSGYKMRQAFFLQALLPEGGGIIDSKAFPTIFSNFANQEEKFKINLVGMSEEQIADLVEKANSGKLSGDKGVEFLDKHGIGTSSWVGASVTGGTVRDGHLYLQGALHQDVGGQMAIKSGQKAHFQARSPRELGINADIATNAPSSQRQMMSLVLGTMDKDLFSRYYKDEYGTAAPSGTIDLTDMEGMGRIYSRYVKEHAVNEIVVDVITEQQRKEFGERVVDWQDLGNGRGRAAIKTLTMYADVLARPKVEVSKPKSRITAAEGRILQEMYPETYQRILNAKDSVKARGKFEALENVARRNMSMPKHGMMDVLDLSTLDRGTRDSLIARGWQLARLTDDMEESARNKEIARARAEAMHEFAPGKLLKYGQSYMAQSADTAHLGHKKKETGEHVNKFGDMVDSFLDVFLGMGANEPLPNSNIKLPSHSKVRKDGQNFHHWKNRDGSHNLDEIARGIASFQTGELASPGVMTAMTDIKSKQIQYHTYTASSALEANEAAFSSHAIATKMGIKKKDKELYQVMERALNLGLITGTAWRSPGVNPKAQMGTVLQMRGQKFLDDMDLGVDLGKGMGGIFSKEWVYSQGGDNDSDAAKTLIHTSIDRLQRQPTQEEAEANPDTYYMEHKGAFYAIRNPYEVTKASTIIERGQLHSAGEAKGYSEKVNLTAEQAIAKVLAKDVTLTNAELSLGSFEQKSLNSKQIGYVFDILTKGMLPLVDDSLQLDAGSLAGRFYQPPLDNKTYKRSEPIANLIEFINSYRVKKGKVLERNREKEVDESAGNLATINQERGISQVRQALSNIYDIGGLGISKQKGNASLQFNARDYGRGDNPLVIGLMKRFGMTDEEIQHAIANRKKSESDVKMDNLWRYTIPAKGKNVFTMYNQAQELVDYTTALSGYGEKTGMLPLHAYEGYDETKGNDYGKMQAFLDDLHSKPLTIQRTTWGSQWDAEAKSYKKTVTDKPITAAEAMKYVDNMLAMPEGSFMTNFENALFKRTNQDVQHDLKTEKPINAVLAFMQQIVSQTPEENKDNPNHTRSILSREIASLITPNKFQGDISPTEARDRIAELLHKGELVNLGQEGRYAGRHTLLDTISRGGSYYQSDSPLNTVTRATTVANMRKDKRDAINKLYEWHVKQGNYRGNVKNLQTGETYGENDISIEEFERRFVSPHLAALDPMNPIQLAQTLKTLTTDADKGGGGWPAWMAEHFATIGQRHHNLQSDEMRPYLRAENDLKAIMQAQSLKKGDTHKYSSSLEDLFSNQQLISQGVMDAPLAEGEAITIKQPPAPTPQELAEAYEGMVVPKPEFVELPDPVRKGEMTVEDNSPFIRPLGEDPRKPHYEPFKPVLTIDAKPDPKDVLRGLGYDVPDKWSTPIANERGFAFSPISLSTIDTTPPVYEQYRTPKGLWYEKRPGRAVRIGADKVRPEVLAKYADIAKPEPIPAFKPVLEIPIKPEPILTPPPVAEQPTVSRGKLTASDLINPGQIMLLNELSKKGRGHFSGQDIDSRIGNMIKAKATAMLFQDKRFSGMDVSGKYNGVDVSGKIDAMRTENGITEMYDFTTSSSANELYGKVDEVGFRTMMKARLLSEQEGYKGNTIQAMMVRLSDENQLDLRKHKQFVAQGGEVNNALIDKFAADLVAQVRGRKGEGAKYDPNQTEGLDEAVESALSRQAKAKEVYQAVKDNFRGVQANLFVDRLNMIPKFALGGTIGADLSAIANMRDIPLRDNPSRKKHYRPATKYDKMGAMAGAVYNYIGENPMLSVAASLMSSIPDWANPAFANGGEGNIKGIGGEKGRELLVDLKHVSRDREGNALFNKNHAIELTKPTMIPEGNWMIVPETKATIEGDIVGVKPGNLGKSYHERPSLKMFGDSEEPEWFKAQFNQLPPQDDLPQISEFDRVIKGTQVGKVTGSPVTTPPPPSKPISSLSMSRPPTPMMFGETPLKPSMLAGIRQMGQAPTYRDSMMSDFDTLQKGGLPEVTPSGDYATTLKATEKYWDKLDSLQWRAKSMLKRHELEQGLDPKGVRGIQQDIKAGVSQEDILGGSYQGMTQDQVGAYLQAFQAAPGKLKPPQVELAKRMLEEIKNTRASLSGVDGKPIANLLGISPLGNGDDLAFLGSALQGKLGEAKGRMTVRDQQRKADDESVRLGDKAILDQQVANQKLSDKRGKIDSDYQFKLDLQQARQAGSTQGRLMGLSPDAKSLAQSNVTAQTAQAAWQQAHERFAATGGYDKPAKEWSRATIDAARTMDDNSKIVRDLNIGNTKLVESTQRQVQTLKSANETSKQAIQSLTQAKEYHEKQRETFKADKASAGYVQHDTAAKRAEADITREANRISRREARIARHEEVLSGQVGNLQSIGVEKKMGVKGHAMNAISKMTDMQNMFYASSSLANYGYMIGSPLMQARSAYIQDEYTRSKISALTSDDGFSKRNEMVKIRQQQSAGEDAYYQFSKGVYKGLEPIYKAIGGMSRHGSDSGTLETLGYYAPAAASVLTMGVVGKMATPILGGAMQLAGGTGAAAGGAVTAAMIAGATLPGLYNSVARGDTMSVLGYDMPFNIGKDWSPIANKKNDNFWDMASNQMGKLDFVGKLFSNVSKYGLTEGAGQMAAIESRQSGWWKGSMAGFGMNYEQGQAAVDNLNKNQKPQSTSDKIVEGVGKSLYTAASIPFLATNAGYDLATTMSLESTRKNIETSMLDSADWIAGRGDYDKTSQKFELETPKLSASERIAGNYEAGSQQQSYYAGTAKGLETSLGADKADRLIKEFVKASERSVDGEAPLPTMSEGDSGVAIVNMIDRLGFKEDTVDYNRYRDTVIGQMLKGNTMQETMGEAEKVMNMSPYSPGSAKNLPYVGLLNAPKGQPLYSDAERQSIMEAEQMVIPMLESLGLAGDPQAVQNLTMKFANRRAEVGTRMAIHETSMETGLTPGDMMSRTSYYWSNSFRKVAANTKDPLMKEMELSMELVDDKGRERGFFEKRAFQDKDTRFKNEMELGAQYKDVKYIDPLDGTTRTRQEITGFSGGEMERKLNSMQREFIQTFGTVTDIMNKFGRNETYTADGEGARWKDNRREQYGLDMTGYSDNLVSKMDYQYTMQTKGHDMQMKNYQMQLDQIDLNLKKQKESFEMSKQFGEKQKAIQLELFNLETKYKYEDLEIAKQKAAKQYGRQMEDFATQRARLGVSHGWKMEDFDTQEYRTEVGRAWQLQDNAMNREQFDLQTGWQSEDFERNIRYASGRQRIDLKRQYERQNIMNNLKLDQMYQSEQRQQIQYGWNMSDIDKNRGREDTQFGWGNQDIDKGERRAGEDFATAIADIDRAKARLDETIPLQRQLIELSNEYWKMQMEFQSKYMKEEEELTKRQRAQITEKMALEQWQFEQQMGWFEIDRQYQEEKAVKDMEIFAKQKQHAEEMAIASERILKIEREKEQAGVAFATQMHLTWEVASKMYPAMKNVAESSSDAARGTGGIVTNLNRANQEATNLKNTLIDISKLPPPPIGVNRPTQPVTPPPATRPGGADNNPNTPFATGGYTGSAPINQVTGVVHGQEYVIPHQGSPVLREPQVVNLLSSILSALQNAGGTQVVLDGEVISRVVDRTVGGHFANAMGNWDRS